MRSLPDPAIGQPAFYYKDDFFDDDEEGNNNHNNGSSANPPRPPQMNSSQAVAGNIFLASSDPAPTMLQQHDDRLHPYHGHHVNPFRDNTEDETPQNGGGFFTNVTAAAAAAATMPVSGKAIRTSGSMPRSTAMLDEFDMQVLRLQNEELIRENQRHLAELQRALIAHAAVAEQQEELRRASGDVRNSVSGGVSVQAMRSLVQEYEKEYLEYAQVMHKID
ncbi:hypothetical protein HDU83_002797 [Entophlyctis luteolus]|nr:hypothetical protein HDU83_002797 [Entophlyctis luteolus]